MAGTVGHNTLSGTELHFARMQIISGPPTTAPLYVGQTVVDQVTGRLYTAKGTSSLADWVTPAVAGTLSVQDTATIDLTLSVGNALSANLVVNGASGVMKWNGIGIDAALILNSDVDPAAAIARSKLASGTADHVLINSGAGVMSSEAQLAVVRGGTGLGSLGAPNGLLSVNAGGTALAYRTLLGTTNQVTVTPNLANYTLSLPQDIDPASTVSFDRVRSAGGYQNNVSPSQTGAFSVLWPATFGTYALDSSSGSYTVTLDTVAAWEDGAAVEFVDVSGACELNPITFIASGGGLISGQASQLLDSQRASFVIRKSGGAFSIV